MRGCDQLTVFSSVHLAVLWLGLLDCLEKFGMQAFHARLLDRAEYSGAQLCAVRLFAACAETLCHFCVCGSGMCLCMGRGEYGCVCWRMYVARRAGRWVGKMQKLGIIILVARHRQGQGQTHAGPCSGRVLRRVMLTALGHTRWQHLGHGPAARPAAIVDDGHLR